MLDRYLMDFYPIRIFKFPLSLRQTNYTTMSVILASIKLSPCFQGLRRKCSQYICPTLHQQMNFGYSHKNLSSSLHYTADYLGDAMKIDGSIETVDLVYDKHSPSEPPQVEKSPLVILHGLFGSKTNNRTVARKLANRIERDVYCLDLRNFGGSPHIDRLDYPSLSADVERFVSTVLKDQPKPILLGHSMGAKTVMAVALRRPEIPKMIVSVDNAPVDLTINSVSMFNKYIQQLRIALEKHQYKDMKDVDAELAKVEPSKVVRQFLLTNLDRGKNDEVIKSKVPLKVISDAVVNGHISGWPYDHRISRWAKGPALFIRGTKSTYVPDDVIPDIGNYFPNFELVDIDSGHWVISEKPDAFMNALCDFIEKHEED